MSNKVDIPHMLSDLIQSFFDTVCCLSLPISLSLSLSLFYIFFFDCMFKLVFTMLVDTSYIFICITLNVWFLWYIYFDAVLENKIQKIYPYAWHVHTFIQSLKGLLDTHIFFIVLYKVRWYVKQAITMNYYVYSNRITYTN